MEYIKKAKRKQIIIVKEDCSDCIKASYYIEILTNL